ncbi:two-component response regulator EHD1-like [Impatiens glandulifera]|uniref:two-component response regulator EHD1-like n=1 Tax=Impatiens glandulifera TaxID=253017 RepID=UPI001FB084A4|nr:two-component response regulator EHD1-like [Impatiens glandulifera]
MWGAGNSLMGIHREGSSQFSNPYKIFTQDCHILVVDNNSEALRATSTLLESCHYQVTAVESGQHALSMLTKRKQHFDLLLTDFHLVDTDVFILLQEAFNMDIPTVFMLVEEDPVIARTAIESGVCFLLEKPTTWAAVKTLWQYAMRDKSQKSNDNVRYADYEENIAFDENGLAEPGGKKMKIGSKKKSKNDKGISIDGTWDIKKKEKTRASKKKACTAWTDELHAKFITAVNQLGEGRCYPKEILQLMNVAGLTRMQVASHLQKCRNDNWRAPESRKSHTSTVQVNVVTTDPEPNRICTRKFGSMPRLAKVSNNLPNDMSSQVSRSDTQDYVPQDQIYAPLGNNLLVNEQGNYRIHEFTNPMNQMETNYLEGNMMLTDLNPRLMETNNIVDHGIYGGHQNMLIGRDNPYAGLDENSSMFIDMNTHHSAVESSYNNVVQGMEPHGSSSHQNPMADDFFAFLPEAADTNQAYAKVFNYGATSCGYNFEPFHFGQLIP